MVLNKEDFAILQEDVHQIENYLRSLMPKIQETIIVRFGDMVNRNAGCGVCVPESEYTLFIGKDTLSGAEGFLTYEFIRDEVKVTGCTNVYSRGHGEEFMQKLVLDWPEIKHDINLALDYQQSNLNKIRNFEL